MIPSSECDDRQALRVGDLLLILRPGFFTSPVRARTEEAGTTDVDPAARRSTDLRCRRPPRSISVASKTRGGKLVALIEEGGISEDRLALA